MALLTQWVCKRPWLLAGIAGLTGGLASIAHGVTAMTSTASALAFGGISTKRQTSEHPFRSHVSYAHLNATREYAIVNFSMN